MAVSLANYRKLNGSLGFIGGGQMASALIAGLISSNVITADRVWVSDPYAPSREKLSKELKVNATESNEEVVKNSAIIILATKPDVLPVVLKQCSSIITPQHLIASIAAGVTISSMEALLCAGARVVRVMPNTPSLVGAGASAYALGSHATDADGKVMGVILSSTGVVHKLKENQMDAVTGLSGSGPAYVFIMIEAMADGGVRAGLPRPVALSLAAQTVFGASKMVLETGKHPGELKDAVCSPGGTTIHGVHELEKGQFRGTIISAVLAAKERSAASGAPPPSKM